MRVRFHNLKYETLLGMPVSIYKGIDLLLLINMFKLMITMKQQMCCGIRCALGYTF